METGIELNSSESQSTAYQIIFFNISFILSQTHTTHIYGFLQDEVTDTKTEGTGIYCYRHAISD